MRAIRKGSPVCPEKKRSFPEVIKLRSPDSTCNLNGYGPIWVSDTNAARIIIKSDTDLRRNGAVLLKRTQSTPTKSESMIAPCTKINSKSNTGVLLKIISSTELPALIAAYLLAKCVTNTLKINKRIASRRAA
jgi:hypothetical protein